MYKTENGLLSMLSVRDSDQPVAEFIDCSQIRVPALADVRIGEIAEVRYMFGGTGSELYID